MGRGRNARQPPLAGTVGDDFGDRSTKLKQSVRWEILELTIEAAALAHWLGDTLAEGLIGTAALAVAESVGISDETLEKMQQAANQSPRLPGTARGSTHSGEL